MIKVHFVVVRAIFGTRSEEKKGLPHHPLLDTDLFFPIYFKVIFHTKTLAASQMISFTVIRFNKAMAGNSVKWLD